MDQDDRINVPYQVRYAGEFRVRDRQTASGAKDDCACLRILLHGRATYRSPRGLVHLAPGTIALFPFGERGLLTLEQPAGVRYLYAKFCGGRALAASVALTSAAGGVVLSQQAPPAVIQAMRHLIACWDAAGMPPASCPDPAEAALVTVLSLLGALGASPASRAVLDRQRLLDFLGERLGLPSDLTRFAAELGLSRSTLVRQARERCGGSVQVLHERLKIERACELLTATDTPVAEISRQLGYDDANYFARVFRKHRATTPRGWRDTAMTGG